MIGRLLFAFLLLAASPATAQLGQALGLPATPAKATGTPGEPRQAIADTADAGADARIAGRIRGIFAELPAFAKVKVAVSQGVVALSGTVPAQGDIARAEAIVSRISGVVTIDNALTRDVSVDIGAGTVTSLAGQLTGLVKMLPLIGVALAVALAIALVGYALAGLTGLWRKVAPNSFLAELIASAIRFAFVLAGLVVALNMIGAGTLLGAVLGGAGVIGLALGFALRETIENYVASLMLSLRQPFRPNDHVVIDSFEGRVIRLTSRATVLMTLDGNHLRIPNSQVFKAVILNYTRNPQRRFQFDYAIDGGVDAAAARRLGLEVLSGLPFVLGDPKPDVRVTVADGSTIVLRFLGWIDQGAADWYKAQTQAIAAAKAAFDAAGMIMPEPTYRLRSLSGDSPAPQAEPPAPECKAEDVEPDREITDMVAAERAGQDSSEDDLLDNARPVE